MAVEITDVISELMLPSELRTSALTIPQQFPKNLLRRGLYFPQLARSFQQPGHLKPAPIMRPLFLPLPLGEGRGEGRFWMAKAAQRFDGTVDAMKLVIAREHLSRAAFAVHEPSEILHQIQQAPLVTSPAQQGVQRNVRILLLAQRLFPIPVVLPLRRQAADLALHPVGYDDHRIVVEKLRDRPLVVRDVLVVTLPHILARSFQFHQHQRQAVHETDQIRPFQIQRPRHPELRGQQEIIVLRHLPIDHRHHLHPLPAILLVREFHRHPAFQQLGDLPVRLHQAQRRPVPRKLLHRPINRLLRQIRIQRKQRRPQPSRQNHLPLPLPPKITHPTLPFVALAK